MIVPVPYHLLKRIRQVFGLLIVLAVSPYLDAAESVYDEHADARKDIAAAIAEASRAGKPARNIVLVFGANWCKDCRALDEQMHKGALASLLEKNFVVVKIDVGRMDKNVDVAKKYGVPVENGIPAVAVLDRKGKLLYAQNQGQFADARHISYESIQTFFERWKPES
jgi:thioredoxin 1